MEAKIPCPLADVDETLLKDRVLGTIWEPGRLQAFPGLLSSNQVVDRMRRTIFHSLPIPVSIWAIVESRLSHPLLWRRQAFTAWTIGKGGSTDQLGPTPLTTAHRTALFAGFSGQRYPANSRKGLDHLLRPGMGKDEHIKQATGLPSPFQLRAWPEPDVDFVLHAIATWQQALGPYAAQCRQVFRQVCEALQPLEEELGQFRCVSAQQVAATKRPGVMAFLTVVLGWPDLKQPLQLLNGYPIVGKLEASGFSGHSSKGSLAHPGLAGGGGGRSGGED